jgi:hypothetical protein
VASLSRVVPAHRVTWAFTWIKRDWLVFGPFKTARKRMKLKEYAQCAWCREPFQDHHIVALAGRPKGANVLLCQNCATEASQPDTKGEAK